MLNRPVRRPYMPPWGSIDRAARIARLRLRVWAVLLQLGLWAVIIAGILAFGFFVQVAEALLGRPL